MKTITNIIYPALAVFTFACLLSPQAAAVCQEGCDIPHENAFLGDDALHSNTTGFENVAIGYQALFNNTTGVNNTAVGAFALNSNTIGNENTACGRDALGSNIGYFNTAMGSDALASNTTGTSNVATGDVALVNNTTGNSNTATGTFALNGNTTGNLNTADGYNALWNNRTGGFNTATGGYALYSNDSGAANVAIGLDALYSNSIGINNTAVGVNALVSSTGSNNVGVGVNAGHNLTAGNGNVCIGAGVLGVAGESNTTRIRNIYSSVAAGRAVYVSSDNKIGTLASSRRVKENIKPMDRASEAILALKPVSFRYKKEIDVSGTSQFGLIAEDVAETDPELVTRDTQGKPETVRYDAVNAMLLNEFLKEHRKIEEQGAMIARQQKQIDALTAGLENVSAQFEARRPAPQVADNSQ